MAAKTYIAVMKAYDKMPQEVKDYFKYLPQLLNRSTRLWEVSLAYMFMQVERAQNMLLYCGVLKLHSANKAVAKGIVDKEHLKRDTFHKLFKNVFDKELKKAIQSKIEDAQKIRDRVVHGKTAVSDAQKRKAIIDILEYARDLNGFIENIAGFKPFGDLRGVKGRKQPLENKTTRWLMKGLGFSLQ